MELNRDTIRKIKRTDCVYSAGDRMPVETRDGI